MQMTPASQRQRAQALRRDQFRRRRAIASAVVVVLIALAVWAAYAIPGQAPAVVPENAAAPVLAETPAVTEDVIIARVEGIEILLPVARDVTTAVAFHSVDNSDAIALQPSGERASGGTLGQRLADIFAGGGGPQYYLMTETDGASFFDRRSRYRRSARLPGRQPGGRQGRRHEASTGSSGGTTMSSCTSSSPAIRRCSSSSRTWRILRSPSGRSSRAARRVLGDVRGFPVGLDQALSRYTSDSGDHVQLMVLRITPELADF